MTSTVDVHRLIDFRIGIELHDRRTMNDTIHLCRQPGIPIPVQPEMRIPDISLHKQDFAWHRRITAPVAGRHLFAIAAQHGPVLADKPDHAMPLVG